MSLSPSTSNNAGQNVVQELRELPLDVIVPNPSQPRRHFDEEALQALAGSYRRARCSAAGARASSAGR